MDNNLAVLRPEQALMDAWSDALNLQSQAGELSDTTRATYEAGMANFYQWLISTGAETVSAQTVQSWKADLLSREYKPNAVNTWLAGVRQFFGWSHGAGLLVSDPTASVKNVKRRGTNKRHLRDPLTDREVLRVLAQPDRDTEQGRRDYAVLCLMAFCALRTIEIHRANFEDLSTVDGLPVLRVQGKGSSDADEIAVVYHPKAQEALYDWLADRGGDPGALFISLSNRSRGERLSLRSLREIVKTYYRAAGVVDPRKTTHSLRHSAISKVARHDVLKARQVARHASIDTTMIYVHEADRLDDPGEAFIDYQNGNGE